MADSFDSRLKLRLQESGGNSGQWGTLLNQTVTNIASVFGYGTHQLSNNADATLTLSDDGASIDALKASYLKITSAVSLTATRTLTFAPNTFNQVKYIENATTGSQSLVIKQGSGATVTVASGKTAVVYFDGAGSGAAVVDALAGVDPGVTDTLAEVLSAGNATGGTDIAVGTGDDVTFADSSKAIFGAGPDLQIYHDGSNSYIEDSGTGALFFKTNYLALQGTNGHQIINAEQGGAVELYHANSRKLLTTSSGLDVTGSVTADVFISADNNTDDTNKIATFLSRQYDSGTETEGFLVFQTFANSSGNRIDIGGATSAYNASTEITFNTAANTTTRTGSERMRLTSAGALEFKGASTTTNAQAFITNDNSTLTIGSSVSGSVVKDIHFNSPSTMMVIDGSSGSVGIGTSSPTTGKLQVKGAGTSNSTNAIFAENSNGAGLFAIRDDGEAFILGKTGIGGSPAFSTLEVIGDKTESNNLQLTLKGASNTNKQMIMGFDTTANTAHITTQIAGSASTPLHFKTAEAIFTVNGSEAGRFDSSRNFFVGKSALEYENTAGHIFRNDGLQSSIRSGGNVADFNRLSSDGEIIRLSKDGTTVGSIGVANGDLNIDGDTGIRFQASSLMPRSGGGDADATVDLGLSSHRFKDLYLSGVANVGGTAKFASWSNSGASNGIEIRSTDGQILNSHTGTGLHVYQYFYNANGVVGSISASGSSTAFNTSSDYRLKENVAPMTGATERLKQLAPKRFNFIADADTTVDGFLAHEVADVVPEAITGAHNEVDDDGNPVYQGIDQSKLVPLLVATIQELEARITQLENS